MIKIPPAFIFIIGSALVPFLKGRGKQIYLLLLPALAFIGLLFIPHGTYGVYRFLEYDLILFRVDRLSLIFGYIFTLFAFLGNLYALHMKKDGHQMSALIYAGSALGVVFSGDYFSLFIFWELMAFSAAFLIWYKGDKAALEAGFRYLLVHIFGGVCLLGGIVLHVVQTGEIQFVQMGHGNLSSFLILVGFILNAAVPPLNAWLPDAYPEATVTGTVFLAAYTTKSAVYVLARAFPGVELLVYLGALMTIYGVVYAILQNDLRRLLSYHIISQVGYMVAGIGMGTEMALNGAVAHAVNNILYKGLLLMGAGAVLEVTGRRKLTEMGGLYKTMPLTFILYMIAGFSISGFPLFNGFISKSMVVSAAAEEHLILIWFLLTLAAVGTFLSTTLKPAYAAFLGPERGIRAQEPPVNMLVGMGLTAFLCIFIGVYPKILYDILPYPVEYHPYTLEHVVWSLQLLLFTAVGFFSLLKKAKPEEAITLDTDWFYRKGSRVFLWLAQNPISFFNTRISELYFLIMKPFPALSRLLGIFDEHVIDGAVNGATSLAHGISRTASVFDSTVVDGVVNGVGTGGRLVSEATDRVDLKGVDGIVNDIGDTIWSGSAWARLMQTGFVQNYAMAIALGLFVIVAIYLFIGLPLAGAG